MASPAAFDGRDASATDLTSATELNSFRLVFADLRMAGALLDQIENETPRLSAGDIARAAGRSAQVQDGGLWRHARIALRVVLERSVGPSIRGQDFEIESGGRPRLTNSPICFSYSHSGDAVLIAVANAAPIGVDLEALRDLKMTGERLARLVTAGAGLVPRTRLSGDDNTRALQAWVRLEAVAKLGGRGIGDVLTKAGVVGAPNLGSGTPTGVGEVAVRDLMVPEGYFAAVAAQRLPDDLVVEQFPISRDALARFLG